MATKIEVGTLNGFFKDQFGRFESMLPAEGYDALQKKIPFDGNQLLGEKLTFPVRSSHSTGWTFAGGATTGTMYALNSPNSGATQEATFTSQEFTIREQVAYKVLRTAQTSKQAFANSFDTIIKDLRESAAFALEFSLLYGGTHLGQFNAKDSGSGTSRVYSLTTASTSAGLWYKLQGALMDAYNAAGSKLNSNADIVVVSADLDDTTNRVVISVTGNSTDLDAVETAISGSAAYIKPKGSDGNWTTGIDSVADVPTTYGGLTTASYPLFKSTSLNASAAALTLSKVLHAKKKNKLKSGPGMRSLIVSDATIADLVDNFSALNRLVNKSGGKLEMGGDTVVYHTPGGMVEIMDHPMQREGEALMVDFSVMKRIGATDFTFDPTGQEEYFEHVSGYAGREIQGYWDQGLVITKPSSITKITGITNTF